MDNFNFIESEIERDPALKAALLADSILKMLPSETALAVQYCVILHWFDQDILKAFLQNFAPLLSTPSSALSEIYEQIADLPFIETLRGGVAFNNLTREGLLKRYALLQSALLINAAKIMAPIYEAREAYGSIAAEAFFCYIISNNTESAMKLLDRLLEEAVCREDWQYVTGVLQLCNEAEQLPFVHPFTLSERQWIILGLAYQAQGEIDSAIDGFHKALEANPRNIRVRMTLAAIYVGQRSYREALQEYDTIIQLDGTYVEAYFNQGIV